MRSARASSARCRRFDAGQAAVVASGRVLAIEAAEGTDAMLARVADMRANGRLRLAGLAGVLVKAPKRGQDLRLDMPAIGPKTIEGAARAQLRGVAVAAGRVLIVERERCAREADAAGLFVVGFAHARAGRMIHCAWLSSPASIRAISLASS